MPYLFFYNLFLIAYAFGIKVVALQNKKARQWMAGRKNWKQNLLQAVATFTNTKHTGLCPVIWMHCASLGEFEQGRPLLEAIKRQEPNAIIVLSFFSPSGFEVQKNYAIATHVCYLPLDSKANATFFIETIKPTLVLWVKYEYWYYFLKETHLQQIPLLLVSGTFRANQIFFKWYGGLFRKTLAFFSHLFLQNEVSATLSTAIFNKKNISISGDTRFDRVITIAENGESLPLIVTWIDGATQVVVAGSTWDEDEAELAHYTKQHPEIKFIIAPHNINKQEIADVLLLFANAQLYSALENETNHPPLLQSKKGNVLIIDNVGMLARLYKYASIAYIGGGFGNDGVHNVLEAAVYGKPVVHGPEFEKYAEAKELEKLEASFAVENALELERVLDALFTHPSLYESASKAAKQYVYAHKGATKKIMTYINENRLLTNN